MTRWEEFKLLVGTVMFCVFVIWMLVLMPSCTMEVIERWNK